MIIKYSRSHCLAISRTFLELELLMLPIMLQFVVFDNKILVDPFFSYKVAFIRQFYTAEIAFVSCIYLNETAFCCLLTLPGPGVSDQPQSHDACVSFRVVAQVFLVHFPRHNPYRQRISEYSCARKETVNMDILVTSRNGDRRIMQSIRITSKPPS